MVKIHNGTHWKPARSELEPITKGKHKGKYRVKVFTGTPEHPQGLSTIIVKPEDIDEDDSAISKIQESAAQAVKFGNGLKQSHLKFNSITSKPQQGSLF